MKFSEYKNEKGQVLLMVLITSTIALIIVTGVFLRVIRLTKSGVERETHEEAFATADQATRKILDQIEAGVYPDEASLPSLLADVTNVVSATRDDLVTLNNRVINEGESIEFTPDNDSGRIDFDLASWNGSKVMITVISYNGTNYSVRKKLLDSCSSGHSYGDLDGITCSSRRISYVYSTDDVTIRLRSIKGNLSVNVSTNSGAVLGYVYKITTRSDSTLSETTLTVASNKTVPVIFDHVLYNGNGGIVKTY